MFGICLGHQLLCRAVGLETFKLPVRPPRRQPPGQGPAHRRIEITSQNHGFAVAAPDGGGGRGRRAGALETDFGAAELTHVNLYDRTVEGLELLDVAGATRPVPPGGGPGPERLARTCSTAFLEAVRAA